MAVLGELENATMNVLWAAGQPLSVRSVHEELLKTRDLAYTTVMTVLDRLAKKKLATRELEGRAWIYRPTSSREQLVADEVISLLGESSKDRVEALNEILDRLDETDLKLVAKHIAAIT